MIKHNAVDVLTIPIPERWDYLMTVLDCVDEQLGYSQAYPAVLHEISLAQFNMDAPKPFMPLFLWGGLDGKAMVIRPTPLSRFPSLPL